MVNYRGITVALIVALSSFFSILAVGSLIAWMRESVPLPLIHAMLASGQFSLTMILVKGYISWKNK